MLRGFVLRLRVGLFAVFAVACAPRHDAAAEDRLSELGESSEMSTVLAECREVQGTGDILLSAAYTFVVKEVLSGDWQDPTLTVTLAPERGAERLDALLGVRPRVQRRSRCRGTLVLRVRAPSSPGSRGEGDALLAWAAPLEQAVRFAAFEAALLRFDAALRARDTEALTAQRARGSSVDVATLVEWRAPGAVTAESLGLMETWRLRGGPGSGLAVQQRVHLPGVLVELSANGDEWRIAAVAPAPRR